MEFSAGNILFAQELNELNLTFDLQKFPKGPHGLGFGKDDPTFLVRNEEVLLLRRFNTGYEDGKYSVIAGHIDEGEDFVSAMRREAKEEAGIDIAYKDLIPVQVMHRKNGNEERVDYFFVSEKWTGNIVNMEPGKCDELSWHRMNELPDNAIPYIASSIHHYLAKETFTSFGWRQYSNT